MMRAALLVVAWCSVASASPLEPLWRTKYKGSCKAPVFELAGELAFLDGKQLTTFDRMTGAHGKPRALPMKEENAQPGIDWNYDGHELFVVGGAIALVGGHWVGAYDAKTFAQLWWDEPQKIGGLPQIESDGTRLVLGYPAHLGADDPGPVLAQVEPRTGKPIWRTTLPKDGQLISYAIAGPRIFAMLQGGEPWVTIETLDAATGKLLWQRVVPSNGKNDEFTPFSMFPSGDTLVVAIHGKEVLVLDGPTGKDRRTIAAVGTSFAVRDGVVFALRDDALTAFTLSTGTQEWTHPTHGGDFSLSVGVLLYHDRDAELHALDPKTGAELATYQLAGYERIYAGSPLLLACGHGSLLALDPTGTPTPPERATITGSVAVKGLPKGVPPPRSVVLNGRVVPLVHGSYKLELEARGTVRLQAPLPDSTFLTESDGYDYTGCEMYVELVGKHAYRASCVGRVKSNYP